MTERDILRKVVAKGKNPDKVKVKDIMNDPVITIDANEDILKAIKLLFRRLFLPFYNKLPYMRQ